MPDLSTLTGWDAKLQFVTGTAVNGFVLAFTSSVLVFAEVARRVRLMVARVREPAA